MKKLFRFTLVSCLLCLTIPFQDIGQAAQLPCLSNFTDGQWAKGQPPEVSSSLSSNLVLFSVKVSAPSTYDFGGVIPIYTLMDKPSTLSFPYGDYFHTRHSLLFSRTVGPDPDGHQVGIIGSYELEQAEGYFGRQLKTVRVGAKAERVPIKVSYVYAGSECSNRTVVVDSYLDITPLSTQDSSSMSEDDLKAFFSGDLSKGDFLKVRELVAAMKMASAWGKSTQKNPLPLILPRSATRPARVLTWDFDFEVNQMLDFLSDRTREVISYVDATGDCLTNSTRDKYLEINWTDTYLSGKSKSCPVYVHLFNKSNNWPFPTEENTGQIVLKVWVGAYKDVKISSNQKRIFCTNGVDFKSIVSSKPMCPAGFIRHNSYWNTLHGW